MSAYRGTRGDFYTSVDYIYLSPAYCISSLGVPAPYLLSTFLGFKDCAKG